jgi:L-asparaginase II
MSVAIDGCGVPTFGLPLDRCAHAFARLPRLDGGSRVVAATGARPDMLVGVISADAAFVRAFPGWVAKGGAEGLFCAGSPSGLGIALKVEDGAFRAIRPALATFLLELDLDPGELGIVTVENSRGEAVGAVRTR